MSDHVRKRIRDATVSALRANAELVALEDTPEVEGSRTLPLDLAALPRVLVYLRGETAEQRISEAPRVYRCRAELVVEHAARLSHRETVLEDELDAVATILEASLSELEASRWGLVDGAGVPIVRESRYQATEVAVDIDGERRVVSLVIRYELEYERAVGVQPLDVFALGVSDYQTGDAIPADRPRTETNLPT